MTAHLTDDLIAALLEARAPAAECDAAMAHMRDCAECRAVYTMSAQALAGDVAERDAVGAEGRK